MAQYPIPTNQTNTFNNGSFSTQNTNGLTIAEGSKYFVTFPITQNPSTITSDNQIIEGDLFVGQDSEFGGDVTFVGGASITGAITIQNNLLCLTTATIDGVLTAVDGIDISGAGSGLMFPDGTIQTTAGGGGGGGGNVSTGTVNLFTNDNNFNWNINGNSITNESLTLARNNTVGGNEVDIISINPTTNNGIFFYAEQGVITTSSEPKLQIFNDGTATNFTTNVQVPTQGAYVSGQAYGNTVSTQAFVQSAVNSGGGGGGGGNVSNNQSNSFLVPYNQYFNNGLTLGATTSTNASVLKQTNANLGITNVGPNGVISFTTYNGIGGSDIPFTIDYQGASVGSSNLTYGVRSSGNYSEIYQAQSNTLILNNFAPITGPNGVPTIEFTLLSSGGIPTNYLVITNAGPTTITQPSTANNKYIATTQFVKNVIPTISQFTVSFPVAGTPTGQAQIGTSGGPYYVDGLSTTFKNSQGTATFSYFNVLTLEIFTLNPTSQIGSQYVFTDPMLVLGLTGDPWAGISQSGSYLFAPYASGAGTGGGAGTSGLVVSMNVGIQWDATLGTYLLYIGRIPNIGPYTAVLLNMATIPDFYS